jgi:predicted Fe-S protein YdhL (DUF1289 family)
MGANVMQRASWACLEICRLFERSVCDGCCVHKTEKV